MDKSRVVIASCKSYDKEEVFRAVKEGIDLLGGLGSLMKKEEKILLKPNLLAKSPPNKAVTTHPAVFEAVGRILREEGYENLTYGDSSGIHLPGLAKIAEGCGIKEPADRLGIEAGDFSQGEAVTMQRGRAEKEFIISRGILEADAIINLCKMKTHQLERLTGAVKNIFGAVYGFNKGALHAKYPDAESFADMLADLNLLVRPRLHIMDGIVAMEGNGPRSGNPVNMNLLLFSKDPVAMDTVFCALIGLSPNLVPTNVSAERAGIGTADKDKIEIMTRGGKIIAMEEAQNRYGNPEFKVSRECGQAGDLHALKPFMPLLLKKPVIVRKKCVGCGICESSCPLSPKAIVLKASGGGKRPVYDYKRCIRCYCCQEMCPEEAIKVKTPVFAKIVDRNWKL